MRALGAIRRRPLTHIDIYIQTFDLMGLIYKHLDKYEEAQECYLRAGSTCEKCIPRTLLPPMTAQIWKSVSQKAISL